MAYRLTTFVNGGFYHVFNRGVEKRSTFSTQRDYQRFLQTLSYYQYDGPKPKFSNQKRYRVNDFVKNPKIIEIVSYCIMPNHFHLLLRQLKDEGIQQYINKVSNSYTKYYNTKHNRVGPLFQGAFKAVTVDTDEQLLHVSRYIHLNPLVANLVKELESYSYSSYKVCTGLESDSMCVPDHILSFFKSPVEYKQFIKDNEDYALRLEKIKHLLIDIEY